MSSSHYSTVPDDEMSFAANRTNKEDLASVMLNGLNNLRLNGDFCDITLRVGEKTIRAHKNVLCVCSPYFMAMFSGRFSESLQQEISMEDVDFDCLEVLIEYMYTGTFSLDSVDVKDILLTASFLQISTAEELCCNILLRKMVDENCIEYILFGGKNSINRLVDAAYELAARSFNQIFIKDDYLEIEFEEFTKLIKKLKDHKKLKFYPEDLIYSFVMRWIHHSYENRKTFIEDLLKLLNPSLISPNVLLSPAIAKTTSPIISSWAPHDNTALPDHVLISRRIPIFRPLRVELFSQAKHRQIRLPPNNAFDGTYTCHGFYIYHQGGWKSTKELLTESYAYHPIDCKWVPFVPLQQARAYHSSCVLNDSIYSIGGTDGCKALSSVEFIDLSTGQRQYIEPLPLGKERAAVGVRENSIYVLQGRHRGTTYKCIHRFDVREGKWQELAPSPFRAGASTCGILGESIYTTHPDTLQRYDIRANDWSLISPRFKRCPPEVFNLGDALYGVFNDHIGKFVPKTGDWKCERTMKCNLSYVHASPNLRFPHINDVIIADPEFDGYDSDSASDVEFYEEENDHNFEFNLEYD